MSRTCQVTGARPGFGHAVSHSKRRTKRRWNVNVQTRHYWVPSWGRSVTLRLSPKGIRTIDKQGIEVVAARLLARGEKI